MGTETTGLRRKGQYSIAKVFGVGVLDPAKQLRLECDASPTGVEAVLSQRVGSVDRPITFRFRSLTSAEENNSKIKNDALALVFAVTKVRDYVVSRQFVPVTDHQPLVGLLREDRPTPLVASERIQKWALLLSDFQ